MPACDRRAVGGVAKGELSPECDRTMFCVFLSRTCVMSVSFMLFIWALTSVYLSLAVVSCVCVLIQDFCVCVCVCTISVCHFVCHVFVCVCIHIYAHVSVCVPGQCGVSHCEDVHLSTDLWCVCSNSDWVVIYV